MGQKSLSPAPSRRIWFVLSGLLLSGCAAVTSTRQSAQSGAAPKNGLSYFLPKGKVVVTLTWNATVGSWDVTPTVDYEADPSERFDLDWSNSVLADTDTTVTVSPETGLLRTINAGTLAQNVNTIGNLIGAAPNIVRLGTAIAPASVPGSSDSNLTPDELDALSKVAPDKTRPDTLPYSATGQVVLNDSDRMEGIALVASPDGEGQAGGSRRPRLFAVVKVTLTKKFELGPDFPKNKKWSVPAAGKGGGIVVRLAIPYELNVREIISADASFQDHRQSRMTCDAAPRTVMLPDSSHDYLYRVLSRPLVADSTKISLSNGMIESLEQTRPSLLAAVLAVPKYLVTIAVPVPVEVNQTQQNISNAQSQISTDQPGGRTGTEVK